MSQTRGDEARIKTKSDINYISIKLGGNPPKPKSDYSKAWTVFPQSLCYSLRFLGYLLSMFGRTSLAVSFPALLPKARHTLIGIAGGIR